MPTAYAIADAAGSGDGTLVIMPVEDAIRVRTGEYGRKRRFRSRQPPVDIGGPHRLIGGRTRRRGPGLQSA
jgi:hypothetical protein